MIRLKPGVLLHNPTNPQQTISSVWGVTLPIIADLFDFFDSPCIITSAFDGVHMSTSLHYKGRALDFRIWHVPEEDRARLVARLQDTLGVAFDVILEKDHVHIEFQPKG